MAAKLHDPCARRGATAFQPLKAMLGAIIGDIIGSVYEARNIKRTDFPLFQPASGFTDDTVLTIATADRLLGGQPDYATAYHLYYWRYPDAGYGGNFHQWAQSGERRPYQSWGNGSAMRAGPVGWAFATLEETLAEARRSAEVTHDHPEGIKGAQAVAAATFLARQGGTKEAISSYITSQFGYDLATPLEVIRPAYRFEVSCQGSVPQALRAFLEGRGYEESVRLAVSIGGDSDTIACMAGGVAEAFHGGIPPAIEAEAWTRLDTRMRATIQAFQARFLPGRGGPG